MTVSKSNEASPAATGAEFPQSSPGIAVHPRPQERYEMHWNENFRAQSLEAPQSPYRDGSKDRSRAATNMNPAPPQHSGAGILQEPQGLGPIVQEERTIS